MKTVSDSGQLLYALKTVRSDPSILPGRIRVHCVRYSCYEYTAEEMKVNEGSFKIHDANSAEAREIAALVKL